jgi:hypothetical protein
MTNCDTIRPEDVCIRRLDAEEDGVPEQVVDWHLSPPHRELDPDSPARRAVLPRRRPPPEI